ITTKPGENSSKYLPNYGLKELNLSKHKSTVKIKGANASLNWIQRGPANVGGRTRCILIDPDDASNKTWFAGTASGGIWKTTDAGLSWSNLTPNIPNLSTTTLAMAPSNHDVIYAGTGEGFGGFGMVTGDGIFYSIDKGANWNIMASTQGDEYFRYVNKLWVDATDDSIIVAATNKGILKTNDGGTTWIKVYDEGYAVQDIVQNPKNPKVLYAGVNRLGILKSTDGGDSWHASYQGIGIGKRFSVAVSPVDTSFVYTTAEVNTSKMDVYISTNSGKNWKKHNDAVGSFINFHGVQGWFNNVLEPHPYDKYKLFVGGVYLGMVEFKENTSYGNNEVMRVDTVGTGDYMGFVQLGTSYLGGGMLTGLQEGANVEPEDFTSIEIRIGAGKKQKAHRFLVPVGEGAGVPAEDYSYTDYVEIPFEVWDTDNDKQLMVSFRDQDRNGLFNLVEPEYDNDTIAREYLFIHSYRYDTLPHKDIATAGGHFEKMIYFFWPILNEDETWNPNNLPEGKISVIYDAFQYQDLYTYIIADDRKNENLHVDHHDIKIIPVDEANDLFTMIDANDGGVAVSYNSGTSWEQLSNGYLTTQFYGVAKKPGAHEYIGGMQDNGTWQSPVNQVATSSSNFDHRIEGDGFEALWHPQYPKRIIGSSYNNLIRLSIDGGENWEWITDGIGGDGPFITRLSHSQEAPNVIFAVGSRGVYRHVNFGLGKYPWQLIEIGEGWGLGSGASSSHLVEVSLADPDVVWAGEAMFEEPDLNLFVSKDQGVTFNPTKNYSVEKMGFLSGLATHPVSRTTAYALFSMKGEPKVLRTTDLGENWTDISGFGEDSTSSNGFPDVIVHCLLVMPNNPTTLWVGTEIGIFESTDNGATWNYADNGLPAVSVWQMDVVDNTIVVATHGRGIWTANATPVAIKENKQEQFEINIYPNPASDKVTVRFTGSSQDKGIVELFDAMGQLVLKTTVNKQEEIQLDVTDLSSGTYFVRMSKDEKSFVQKLIIQSTN
ncbi:MAG: T9SS type A sorting domain-containing protein, partial [Bacteroidales bacterium]|nr:T9SS type A sorting domain-containing protein [Bacteroidales bacterium]